MVTLYDVDYKYNRNSSKENEKLETGRSDFRRRRGLERCFERLAKFNKERTKILDEYFRIKSKTY